MTAPDAHVAVDRRGGVLPVGDGARAGALSNHEDELSVAVDVANRHVHDLRAPDTTVDQEPDEGGIAAVLEVSTLTGVEELAQQIIGEHRNWGFADPRRRHAVELVGPALTLVGKPLEPLCQRPVALRGGSRLELAELVGGERLDVLPVDPLRRGGHPVGAEEGDEPAAGVPVDPHGTFRLVGCPEVTLEVGEERGEVPYHRSRGGG